MKSRTAKLWGSLVAMAALLVVAGCSDQGPDVGDPSFVGIGGPECEADEHWDYILEECAPLVGDMPPEPDGDDPDDPEPGGGGGGGSYEAEVEAEVCLPGQLLCLIWPFDPNEPRVLAARTWITQLGIAANNTFCTQALQAFDLAVAEGRAWFGTYSSPGENHGGQSWQNGDGVLFTHVDADALNNQLSVIAWIIIHEGMHMRNGTFHFHPTGSATAPYGFPFDEADACSGHTP